MMTVSQNCFNDYENENRSFCSCHKSYDKVSNKRDHVVQLCMILLPVAASQLECLPCPYFASQRVFFSLCFIQHSCWGQIRVVGCSLQSRLDGYLLDITNKQYLVSRGRASVQAVWS